MQSSLLVKDGRPYRIDCKIFTQDKVIKPLELGYAPYRRNVSIRITEQGEDVIWDSRIPVKLGRGVKREASVICHRVINGRMMHAYLPYEPC